MTEPIPSPFMPDMNGPLKLLQQYRHIAVVGLSAKQYRPSHSVSSYMQAQGYDIIPINPRYAGTTILGKHVYATLTAAKEAGELIEIVDVFRKAEKTLPIVEEAATIGAKVVWLQLGIRNTDAENVAHENGLIFIQDKCIKVEHGRLLGGLHTTA